MTNQKQTTKKIDKGVYDYKGYRISARKVSCKSWDVVKFKSRIFFDLVFPTLKDAKRWIDKNQYTKY